MTLEDERGDEVTSARTNEPALVDLVDVLLRDGAVLHADVIITVADVPLVGIELRAMLSGMETMTDYGQLVEWDESLRERGGEPGIGDDEVPGAVTRIPDPNDPMAEDEGRSVGVGDAPDPEVPIDDDGLIGDDGDDEFHPPVGERPDPTNPLTDEEPLDDVLDTETETTMTDEDTDTETDEDEQTQYGGGSTPDPEVEGEDHEEADADENDTDSDADTDTEDDGDSDSDTDANGE